MQQQKTIDLKVCEGAKQIPWRHFQAENGTLYSYLFTGGDDGEGGIHSVIGKGPVDAIVTLKKDQDCKDQDAFAIQDCDFLDDANAQLSTKGRAPRNIVIFNKNDKAQTAKYVVRVEDTRNGALIRCHPPVINRIA